MENRTKDYLWAATLSVIVCLTWCSAHAIGTIADLYRAPAYIENPEKCDVIDSYADLKSIASGQSLPFCWKFVKELGAPYEANWNDWPIIEEVQLATFGLLARMFGIFAGMNLGMLLGNVLAALCFYVVARSQDCARLWAFVGGLAFGLAPFIFAHTPHHVGCEWVWYVVFYMPVWRWVSTEPGLRPGDRRFTWALVSAAVTGVSCPYFTNIFCQLTLLGALVQFWRTRSKPPLMAALAVIGVAAAGFALVNLDTWTFQLVHGPNPGAVVREYKWMEIYGLKIKDLFIPPATHRWDALSSFAKAHWQAAPLLDEGASYQGIVGLACLLWLVGTALRNMVVGREKDVPLEAWQVLWIVLMFTTGGLNAIIGAAGFTMFRASCRYSIVILAITLLWAARRLTVIQAETEQARSTGGPDVRWLAAAVAVCLLILWDQVPRAPTADETATIARQVAADREFTEKMEAALPTGAMVFQMPVMDYPESPAPGVPPYDHFRPYLFSKHLRYSFGSMKGRERERWQAATQAKFFEGATLNQESGTIRVNAVNARTAVDELLRRGFSAIYVNRNGFPDRGKGLEETLLDLGYTRPPIRNATGDLACIVLKPRQESEDPASR